MTPPMISIVTPCLNRADFIREAIESVLVQNYPNLEHIVTDAGSTDGTLDILRSYPQLRVVSEPDNGIFDGMNKGLRMTRGEIVGILNSDDLYAEGCLEAVARTFEQNPDAQAVVGGISVFYDDEKGRHTVETVPAIEPAELWYRLIRGNPATNSWFFRRTVFERMGYFDVKYRYSADYEFLIRLALDGGVRPVPVRQLFYQYRQHSGSGTITSLDSRSPKYGQIRMKILRETIEILESLLLRTSLPKEVRRPMHRAHGEACYRLTATALYHHQWQSVKNTIHRGWRRNILWPLIFIEMAFRRVWKEIVWHE